VAPLNEFRIILKVDERDVDYIALDQVVSVVLSAFPEKRLETHVNKVTPVSAAAEGRNYFRVEASYRATDARMRPGMEGVAKITIDERPLLWIWTRELVDWARLWLWRWLS
jgi:multidrug efflux pump subunit AcrA (membrane-fusion protein)